MSVTAVQSKPTASIKRAADDSPSPQPDLAGQLLQPNSPGPVYLIDAAGYARWIPNTTTFNNIFGSGATIRIEPLFYLIAQGSPIEDGAILFRGDATFLVFITDHGTKRSIDSPTISEQYQFHGPLFTIPQIVVNSVPPGPDWTFLDPVVDIS